MPTEPSAWSGRFSDLVLLPRPHLQARLEAFIPDATAQQKAAWAAELEILEREGAHVLTLHPPAASDGAILEYKLPREAGRRPDVLVLQNGRLVVVEFKESGRLRRSDIDQVAAYARDLAQYHDACEGLSVVPLLVLCGAGAPLRLVDDVRVVPASGLAAALVELGRGAKGTPVALDTFLRGEYAPLPSLVAAARLLFENLPLPFVRRAASAGVHRAVESVLALARAARERRERILVLLTGVPGAGKTLVGLQVAHSAALEEGYRVEARSRRGAPATFLSGNGPLVQVLQQALQSKAFVQDMHRYIREYGLEHARRVPPEHVVVFDEAQRAWDREKIADFYGKKLPDVPSERHHSEPDLLIEIANRVEGWSLVLALVGEGQEIHTGEEAGIAQWATAVGRSPTPWRVVGPARLARLFPGRAYEAEPALDLDVSLRAQAAGDLHKWVATLLEGGEPAACAPLGHRLRHEGFPIYVTRDLAAAKTYARDRFSGEADRRYGLLASSKAKNLVPYGIDPGFQATKVIRIGNWFNDGPDSERSCCQLKDVVTEFQCQGLELDLPVVCWGDDFVRGADGWQMSARSRRQPLVRDPMRLRTNTYRVLLTRGREGLVVFVPDAPAAAMNGVFEALVSAGAIPVEGGASAASA